MPTKLTEKTREQLPLINRMCDCINYAMTFMNVRGSNPGDPEYRTRFKRDIAHEVGISVASLYKFASTRSSIDDMERNGPTNIVIIASVAFILGMKLSEVAFIAENCENKDEMAEMFHRLRTYKLELVPRQEGYAPLKRVS